MVTAYIILIAVVGIERLVELRLSRRNAEWAFARGGVEYGHRHFGAMKVLHTALLVGCVAEVVWLDRPFNPALGIPMLLVAAAAQGLRYWAISSLGQCWNVRVIVVPGLSAVVRGPYRLMRHPNYVAVVAEGLALPLIHSAYITAVTFTLLNLALLYVRIGVEERALAQHCQYQVRHGNRRRFFPTLAAREST